MSDLYKRIDLLCKKHGTNVTAMCKEMQVARSSFSELNSGRTKTAGDAGYPDTTP